MRLSSMADYAVVTMTAAARHCGHARISAQQLADETGLPAPTVQKLVSKLSAARLLRSVRGARGGLTLARPAAAISLADIIEAVEGPIAMAACSERLRHEKGRHDCTLESACSMRPHWPVVDAALRGALAGVSLSQLAAPGPVTRTAAMTPMIEMNA
jgi:FeS assembly SUF system regulator